MVARTNISLDAVAGHGGADRHVVGAGARQRRGRTRILQQVIRASSVHGTTEKHRYMHSSRLKVVDVDQPHGTYSQQRQTVRAVVSQCDSNKSNWNSNGNIPRTPA